MKNLSKNSETQESLTEEDKNMIRYFHEEKGDISRWSKWEEKLPIIHKQYPELIEAIRSKMIASTTLDIIVRNL